MAAISKFISHTIYETQRKNDDLEQYILLHVAITITEYIIYRNR